jgi:uncharacterized cupin superfamily protein
MKDNEVGVLRMFTGDDMQTHFEDVTLRLHDDPIGWDSGLIAGIGSQIRIVRGDRPPDFHCAPRRQFVIVLSGVMEVEAGDGTIRRLQSGEILLAEDLTGQGHRTNNAGTVRRILIVPVDDFDLDLFRSEVLEV